MVRAIISRFSWNISLLIPIFLQISIPTHAKYGGGTGESNDPYLIYTAEQMDAIGAEPNDWDKNFKLMADIDLSGFSYDAALIAPDTNDTESGFTGIPFTGVFDGNDHTISHLTIEGVSYLGLFGLLRSGAEVRNLGVVDVNITSSGSYAGGLVGRNLGKWSLIPQGNIIKCYSNGSVIGGKDVGGLVGYNDGYMVDCYSIVAVTGNDNIGGLVGNNGGRTNKCYSSGTVNGTESVGGLAGGNYRINVLWGRSGSFIQCCSSSSVTGSKGVGGLVGYNEHNVAACYSTGAVSGIENVGGLVGENASSSSIANCYSTGSVLGSTNVGGLLGNNINEVTDSFWDTETSGQTTSAGGIGKTTAEMHKSDIFMDAGWDLVGQPDGPHDIWAMPIGDGYPILWWQISPPPALPTFSGGTGEPDNPYLISTADQLNSIGHNQRLMRAHFKLIADIDLSGIDFFLIGSELYPFGGVLDGNGKKISNFTNISKEQNLVGLFRYVNGATIKDLGLIEPIVDAGTELATGVGSLAGGIDKGTISNCYAEGGRISGYTGAGGLVGILGDAIMTDCFTLDTNISGYAGVGGLAGGSRFGMIIHCFSSGCFVSGELRIGGLVGVNESKIANCYAICNVLGSNDIGGLVGGNSVGSISSSFSTSKVSGNREVGGLVGSNNVGGSITSSYSTSSVSGSRYVGGLVGHNGNSIANSYSTGMVSGNWSVGGLVGIGGGVKNCFWDIQTSTIHESDGGTGLTTEEMQEIDTYLSAGWDFVGQQYGPHDIWTVPIGGGYPILRWQISLLPELPAFSGGFGEPDNPYLISTAGELNSIGHNPRLMAAHFKLLNDIDLTGINFHIIGSEMAPFTGVFDGNRKKILNFTYTATEEDFIGLFRYVDGATIKDLGLITPNVDAGVWSNIYSLHSYGSLIGYLKDGIVSNCYAKGGSVNGNVFFESPSPGGGLVGTNEGIIANCYSTASVSANNGVGGLVGFNLGTIINCYATGSISGLYVSGLVRYNGGKVYNSFWDIQTSGQTTSTGGMGKTTAELQSARTFLDAGWDFIDETTNGMRDIWWIDEGQDYPRLWWEALE